MSNINHREGRFPRNTSRSAFLAVMVSAVLLVLAACSDEEVSVGPGFTNVERGVEIPIVIPGGEPIVIGVSTALTGSAAPRGQEYRDAVVVAVQQWKAARGGQIGGHDIVVVSEDDGCTASGIARSAAGRLLMRPGLVGVLGPQCSAGTVTAQSVYSHAGIVTISGSATATGLAEDQSGDGYFFRTAYRNDFQGTLIGVYFSTVDFLGAQHAYIIDDRERYGTDLASSAESVLREAGVQISRASINQGEADFSKLAGDIAMANPDAVLFAGFNPEAILLLRQLRDAGWNGSYAAGDAVCGAAECEFLEALGDLAEGAAFSGCSPIMEAPFLEEFTVVHGSEPTAAFVTQYADATTILLNAVASVAQVQGETIEIAPKALREAVATSALPGGLSGEVAFNSDGDRASSPAPEDLDQFARELGLVPCRIENGAIAYFN